MRWAALAIVAAAAGSADARMVRRRDPPVVEACRNRKDWSEVTKCLDKLGSFRVERTLDRARLVRVSIREPGLLDGDPERDAGVYLFVQQKDGTWLIGGMATGVNATVIDLAAVTIHRHLGYRLDMGTLEHTPLSLDRAPPVTVSIRRRSSLYCYGNDYRCIDVPTDCDVMTRGTTLLVFHGTTRVDGGDVVVDGDASYAGSICTSSPRFTLGWEMD